MIPLSRDGITEDTFFEGKIVLRQPRNGYRFSLDAPVLASHAKPRTGDTVLDLGTGCGIVSLLMAWRRPDIRVIGVEIQEALAALAMENVAMNCLESRVKILHADMRTIDLAMIPMPVDMVVTNPPYRRIPSGRINPDTQRAVARHEVSITLAELLHVARRVLKTGGRFLIVYSAERLADLFRELDIAGFEPKKLRTLHTHPGAAAKICLVEAVKGGRPGIHIGPPLIIYESDGAYTAQIRKMFVP